MQEQAPHVTPHSALGRGACAHEISEDHAHLSYRGQRVYDAPDIPALMAINVIPIGLELARQMRLRRFAGKPTNERDRHLLEFGHEFGFGCCRDQRQVDGNA